jgi:hypothetical protein
MAMATTAQDLEALRRVRQAAKSRFAQAYEEAVRRGATLYVSKQALGHFVQLCEVQPAAPKVVQAPCAVPREHWIAG